MSHRPVLSNAARPSTFTVDAIDETGVVKPTPIAGEHPLTIYIDKREILTIMTLGSSPEALVIGYLRNQRLLASIDDIISVQVDWEVNACSVVTRNGLANLDEKMAKRTKTTGCGEGTVFGDLMADIDNIQLRDDVVLHEETLFAMLNNVRGHESIYKQAGAVHGCALVVGDAAGDGTDRQPGSILTFVEDVGRHNAVDAIAGWMWLNDIDGSDKIFYTTGRLTSEMVIKAAQMRIPFLVSRSGLTAMGYDIATRVGMTMIGRAVNRHYLLFAGQARFVR